MARNTPNGRVSVSPAERECITTMFWMVAALIRADKIDVDALEDELVRNLDYGDIDYPPDLDDSQELLENEEFVELERKRADYRRTIALQRFVDIAADFGVRLELADLTNRKW